MFDHDLQKILLHINAQFSVSAWFGGDKCICHVFGVGELWGGGGAQLNHTIFLLHFVQNIKWDVNSKKIVANFIFWPLKYETFCNTFEYVFSLVFT